jgi:hypothetical protein
MDEEMMMKTCFGGGVLDVVVVRVDSVGKKEAFMVLWTRSKPHFHSMILTQNLEPSMDTVLDSTRV